METRAGFAGLDADQAHRLQAVFAELQDRIGPLLDKGARVRIV